MGAQQDHKDGYDGVDRPVSDQTLPYIWGREQRKKDTQRMWRMPEGDGSQTLGLLGLPILFWPGLLVWKTWGYLTLQNPDMGLWPKVGICVGELAVVLFLLNAIFKRLPRWLGGLAMAGYFAFSYWWAASQWFSIDRNTSLIIAAVSALIGYAIGRSMSAEMA
jgi:hypothetical protein